MIPLLELAGSPNISGVVGLQRQSDVACFDAQGHASSSIEASVKTLAELSLSIIIIIISSLPFYLCIREYDKTCMAYSNDFDRMNKRRIIFMVLLMIFTIMVVFSERGTSCRPLKDEQSSGEFRGLLLQLLPIGPVKRSGPDPTRP
ncbi:hypothetical protein VNO78_21994 [Psophocarpus tetragonolobus]|uniref:Uncharacterized protein n=1 Tax=Psophocarpus tetragonolobus TaxID=3891 RepID=A0AAN9SG52_PSOTE